MCVVVVVASVIITLIIYITLDTVINTHYTISRFVLFTLNKNTLLTLLNSVQTDFARVSLPIYMCVFKLVENRVEHSNGLFNGPTSVQTSMDLLVVSISYELHII